MPLRTPSRGALSYRGPGAVTSAEKNAAFHQAKVLMQAGISSSITGKEDDALKFFAGAHRRFQDINNQTDASIAQGWIDGLKDRLASPQP